MRSMNDAYQSFLDRTLYGVSFQTQDGKRVDPRNVESANGPLEVKQDPERMQQERARVRALFMQEPTVFQGEPPTVDEVMALAQKLRPNDA